MVTQGVMRYSDISEKLSFSPSSYETVSITNNNCHKLHDLISSDLKKGQEVGSDAYIHKSNRFFLRTKALQAGSYLLDITQESSVPMIPQSFVDHKLRKGQILISKDSNIGEVAYLDRDYPAHMMSAGLMSFEIKNNPFYVLAMMKDPSFKKQLNSMVPTGTTIKHAKRIFLDCRIPFPNCRSTEMIKFIEETTKAIIRREVAIRANYRQIGDVFEGELFGSCKPKDFTHYMPRYSEINSDDLRLDTGIYEREYLRLISCIESYANGSFKIPLARIKAGSTPKNRRLNRGYKKWITPTIFGELGFFTADERIHCTENNITRDCVIIKNRTLKEKLGRFVGTAVFYDFEKMHLGHHNQGCYRVEDYSSEDLKYIALVLNTQVYRKLCGYISLGSKMREIKMNQFAAIPFPNIGPKVQGVLVEYYYHDIDIPNNRIIHIERLEDFDLANINQFGILQLAGQMHFLQKLLSTAIKNIFDDKEPDVDLQQVNLLGGLEIKGKLNLD